MIQTESKGRLNSSIYFLERLQEHSSANPQTELDEIDFERVYLQMKTKKSKETEWLEKNILMTARGRPVRARSEIQSLYVHSLLQNPLTICIGPAGTGKTFISIAAACSLLLSGKRERIVITRPAVEAGESLGFLPGDLSQKVDPYLRPLYDALNECLGAQKSAEMIQDGRIEIAPLAYMRGRTLNESVILLDEGQNSTLPQLKMFLTRLGHRSSMCISGDVTQIDLSPGTSGLEKTAFLLEKVEGTSIIRLKNKDIVRSALVKKILDAFDNHGNGSK